jgi:Cytochrome C oxidase, cbb3-type, subunit III
MSDVSHEVRGAGRPLIRWTGLAAVVLLLAACGGEGRESANAGTEGAAVTDSAPPASADTVAAPAADIAATATDTSTAGATGDTTARQQAQRPAAPAAPTKPAAPAKPAAPSKPAAPAQDTATTAQGTATAQDAAAAEDTATLPTETASGQDTAAAASETQTADAPLRDQYHQAPKDTVDQATYDGWKQYNLNCARCHGEDVQGSTIAPHLVMSLKPDGPINTPELFTQVVCAGRPAKGMPSWCALGMEPAKIGQIYSYVKGRSEGKLSPGRPAVKPEG